MGIQVGHRAVVSASRPFVIDAVLGTPELTEVTGIDAEVEPPDVVPV